AEVQQHKRHNHAPKKIGSKAQCLYNRRTTHSAFLLKGRIQETRYRREVLKPPAMQTLRAISCVKQLSDER
ncbi:hypothetical protein, partial [Oceanidesulfovibrio marinus]|uniref:hypothetical protein n=1 Tax=Oceanidesulfovibrio marinus TaxID=370038 RepID=UPI001ABFCFBB